MKKIFGSIEQWFINFNGRSTESKIQDFIMLLLWAGLGFCVAFLSICLVIKAPWLWYPIGIIAVLWIALNKIAKKVASENEKSN